MRNVVILSAPSKANWALRESCMETGEPTEGRAHTTFSRQMGAELEKLPGRWRRLSGRVVGIDRHISLWSLKAYVKVEAKH